MGLYLTLMTDIDPYICPHIIFYQMMLSFSQICSHMRNLTCMVTMKKKRETGHDETNLSFEESSVGLLIFC